MMMKYLYIHYTIISTNISIACSILARAQLAMDWLFTTASHVLLIATNSFGV